jgi:hypothetical protein
MNASFFKEIVLWNNQIVAEITTSFYRSSPSNKQGMTEYHRLVNPNKLRDLLIEYQPPSSVTRQYIPPEHKSDSEVVL